MLFIFVTINKRVTYAIYRHGEKGTWWQFEGQDAANGFASQLGNAAPVALETWNERKQAHA